MSKVLSVPDSQPICDQQSKFNAIVSQSDKERWHGLMLFWVLIGPGLLAAMADNDAGGMISYCVTGVKFGIGLFIPLVLCLVVVTYTVQEMAMRLGTVTQTGFTKLICDHYGRSWLYYHLTTLFSENLLTLVTEFIGMTAGLIILGLPLWASDLTGLLLILSITVFTGYWTKERLALLIGALNVIFVVVACMTHPSLAAIGHAFAAWNVPAHSGDVSWYVIALIGNAIAPWMIFYQGSAYIDKGVVAENLRFGRIDTYIGCAVQVVIAACAIVAGAALFGHLQNVSALGPSDVIGAFDTFVGRLPAVLFALGIFNAGLLASITVSLSSSWSVSEAFGWSKSLNDKIADAPKFYAIYIGSVVAAAVAILIPHLPLNFMAILAQIIGGFLTAPILVFLILLTNNKQLMGKYKNGLGGNIFAWTIAATLVGLAVLLMWNALAGLL
jgi:Mn2+/Fe2+ NRAMP family transporter